MKLNKIPLISVFSLLIFASMSNAEKITANLAPLEGNNVIVWSAGTGDNDKYWADKIIPGAYGGELRNIEIGSLFKADTTYDVRYNGLLSSTAFPAGMGEFDNLNFTNMNFNFRLGSYNNDINNNPLRYFKANGNMNLVTADTKDGFVPVISLGLGGGANHQNAINLEVGGNVNVGLSNLNGDAGTKKAILNIGGTDSNRSSNYQQINGQTIATNGAAESFVVGGNVNLYAGSDLNLNVNSSANISGKVNMYGGNFVLNNRSVSDSVALNAVVNIGGLNETGNVFNTATKGSSTLTITTSSSNSFNGSIYDNKNSSNYAMINLIVKGNGTQKINSADIRGTTDVQTGTLLINGSLKGKVSVGEIATFGANNGSLNISNTLEFSNGSTFAFSANDSITVESLFLSTQLNVTFDTNGLEINKDYMLIDFASINKLNTVFNIINSDLTGDIRIEDNKIIANFSKIPEPSTLAGLLGFSTLLIAVYRKRK